MVQKFITKNEAVKTRVRQSERLWNYERVADSGYYAFNFTYKEEHVRTQEEMIQFWGYAKYLHMYSGPDDGASGAERGMKALSLSSM